MASIDLQHYSFGIVLFRAVYAEVIVLKMHAERVMTCAFVSERESVAVGGQMIFPEIFLPLAAVEFADQRKSNLIEHVQAAQHDE